MRFAHPTVAFALALLAFTLPAHGHAQSSDEAAEIERAVAPAPARYQADAMVISLEDDGSISVLREGSNGLMCWDRSSEDSYGATCTDEENMDRVAQNWEFTVQGGTEEEIEARFEEAEENGTRATSGFGTVYYHMNGDTQETAGSHLSIVVPFATAESVGMPASPRAGGLWLMDAGTSSAHLMLPGH